MARITYRFQEPPSLDPSLIPGVKVSPDKMVVAGHPDALDVLGVNIYKEWPHLKEEKYTVNFNTDALRKYQQVGTQWLVNTLTRESGAILADDMGLGKTRTAIYTASMLPRCNHILVVCPAGVVYQWADEASVFKLPSHILGPPSKGKRFAEAWSKASSGMQSIYITSYNLAEKALKAFPHPPQCVIFDEPHMVFRGRTNKWAWAVKEQTEEVPYKLACTGTPMFNQPRDMWFILFILFGMRFGKAKDFDKRYCDGKQGTYGWENKGASNLGELKRRLSHYMLRRTTEDVALELPPLTTSFRWVEASVKAQAAMMKATGGANATDEALHACLDEKIALTVETACELQEPVVVFTYHRHHADEIASKMEEEGKSCVSIHGGLSVTERHNLIQQCTQSGTSVAATIDSCGTGVNMQGVASKGIFHTIERSPKKTHQAMKRLHRSGQNMPVHWVFIAMKDAMDEIVVDSVVKRLDYWQELMGKDAMEENVGSAIRTNEELETEALKAIYESMKS